MSDVLAQIMQVGFLAAILRIATPLIFATLGEMFSERAGVLNLGIEGIMLISAMTGFSAAYYSGNLWIGIAAAIATGAAFGFLHAVLTVALGLSQHVAGIGLTLFSTGLAYYLFRLIFGQQAKPPSIVGFTTLPIPLLSEIPIARARSLQPVHAGLSRDPGRAARRLRALSHAVGAGAAHGRREPACGGFRLASSVVRIRFQAVVLGGALMGVAGAFLSMAQFNAFTFGVISGRGWVAIALVVFGRWDPWRCAGAALLFAAIDALQLRLQASGLGHIPYQVFLVLPFVLTIVAMALVSRNAVAPAALLKPFRKEER